MTRSPRTHGDALNALTLAIDRDGTASLQDQIRRGVVRAIVVGSLPQGMRLPSSRALASHLRVARNTVTAAYQQLVAEGLLVARDRSGIYVSDAARPARATPGGRRRDDAAEREQAIWAQRVGATGYAASSPLLPPDWRRYPYPFVDGRLDRSLFPTAEWRDASRASLSALEIDAWASDSGEADDAMLVEEVRTKVLPRRGVHAARDEVLITFGAHHAQHLIAQALVREGQTVAVEDPGNPELRAVLARRGARVIAQPVDAQGLVVDERLSDCEAVFLTPGHHRAMGVALSDARRKALAAMAERHDLLLVEDDYESESSYAADAAPALRAGGLSHRTAYAATLAQPLAPALRLGVLCGPAPLIQAARTVRRLESRQPPLSVQRFAAQFLALGLYDATLTRIGRVLAARMTALRDALNHYLPRLITFAPVKRGTAYWIEGPGDLDAGALATSAEARGILVEPARRYFAEPNAPANIFRMGVSSIPEDRIREGVAALAQAIRDARASARPPPTLPEGRHWDGDRLKARLAGVTLLTKTVYGDPCTIELHRDGSMSGRAGFANEDTDDGAWWIEGDLWCRRWRTWAYGETAKFLTTIDGDAVRWFNADGRLIDSALLAAPLDPPGDQLDP